MNSQILRGIQQGELILFLGAGASFGCKTSAGEPIPMSGDLAKSLADAASLPYEQEALDVVYEAARGILGVRLNQLLERDYRHVLPSLEYEKIAKYAWRRIYTLNIDDGLDKALIRNSQQNINKLSATDPVIDKDVFFNSVEYIKLNGTADRLQDGIIFSPSEYATAAATHLPWYSQCASDFVRSPMLFIGTQLNEPLLKFHIERYQSLNPNPRGTSFLIARSATAIQIASLKRYNIEFIPGTLADFVAWLTRLIPTPPTPSILAEENIPQLKALRESSKGNHFANLFEKVIVVKRDSLPKLSISENNTIRDFYKGFKPSWSDIVESIPAELEILQKSIETIRDWNGKPTKRLLPFVGPAGSGKTTLLMQLCWHFSHDPNWNVYFIDAAPDSLFDTLLAIESSSPAANVLVAIDNIEFATDHLAFALKSQRLLKTKIIGAERESVWSRHGRHVLQEFCSQIVHVRDFSAIDAEKLLERLKRYGSWTRLGKMSAKDQIKELLDKSKKQLLIALLEATLGRGFEKIIEDEYKNISTDEERLFLVTVAIVTDRRCEAPISLVDRALDKMSILRRSMGFAEDLAGIVHRSGDKLFARHPVYAKYLIDRVVDPTISARAIVGVLQAFSDYKSPVIQNIPKSEAVLYKSLINHKFLFEILRGNETRILQTYQDLEKKFEKDGLFWLQYGLALRDFGDNSGALEKLRIACDAYRMPHTLHALGQQLLISALVEKYPPIAMGLAAEAIKLLEGLDDIIDSDDTYPLVTLAEGYTSVLRRHASESEARSFAKRYTLILENRAKHNTEHARLQIAYERMFKYATVGIWTE